jgi:hypothetical protein
MAALGKFTPVFGLGSDFRYAVRSSSATVAAAQVTHWSLDEMSSASNLSGASQGPVTRPRHRRALAQRPCPAPAEGSHPGLGRPRPGLGPA